MVVDRIPFWPPGCVPPLLSTVVACLLRIILLVSINHTFGGCAANLNMFIARKALRFILLCSRLARKVLTSALQCSNYCCAAVIIVEWCGSVRTPRHAEQPWYSSWHPQRWETLPPNERKCAKAFDPRATTQEPGHPGPSAGPEVPFPARGAPLVPLRLCPRRQ